MSVRGGKSGKAIAPNQSSQSSSQPSKQKGAMVPHQSFGGISVSHPSYPPRSPSTNFQVLGQIPKPYSSALASQPKPFDPFENPNQLTVSSSSNPVMPRSEYIPIYETNQFYIEHFMKPKDDPVKLATQYFPKGWHFIPTAPYKSLAYYKNILLTTESVHIKPIFDRKDESKIVFHSLYIKQIIPQDAFTSTGFSHPSDLHLLVKGRESDATNVFNLFSYYDYIEAWNRVFLYQNESMSHSWFIQFDHKFKSQISLWFTLWWTKFGPVKSIFPELLLAQVNHFSNKAQFNKQMEGIPILLRFVSKYKIPWILKWQYNLPSSQGPVVSRLFFAKWWDKFDLNRIVKQVQTEFPILPINSSVPISGSSSKIKKEKSDSTQSIDLDNYSASELKQLALAIRQKTDKLQEDEGKASSSSSSAESSHESSPDIDPYSVNLQDAQDPFSSP